MRKKNHQTKVITKQRPVKQGVKVHTPVEPEPFDAMAYLMSMPEEPSKPPETVDDFDPLDYACPTPNWPHDWPAHIIPQFEAQGFTRIRLEQVVTHPVWELYMKNPAGILTVAEASRVVRDVIEPYGRIPRNGFICTSNKYGIIKATFILEY
jgi:hypothetical protein